MRLMLVMSVGALSLLSSCVLKQKSEQASESTSDEGSEAAAVAWEDGLEELGLSADFMKYVY